MSDKNEWGFHSLMKRYFKFEKDLSVFEQAIHYIEKKHNSCFWSQNMCLIKMTFYHSLLLDTWKK